MLLRKLAYTLQSPKCQCIILVFQHGFPSNLHHTNLFRGDNIYKETKTLKSKKRKVFNNSVVNLFMSMDQQFLFIQKVNILNWKTKTMNYTSKVADQKWYKMHCSYIMHKPSC